MAASSSSTFRLMSASVRSRARPRRRRRACRSRAVVMRSSWPTSSPIRAHGIPPRWSSDTRRCRRSCGENCGTPAAVQARVIAVRKRSPPKPWKTGRSGMRSSRATSPRDGLEEHGRDRHPPGAPGLRHGAGDAPAPPRLVDVAPGERLELADPHSGRVEHEQRAAGSGWGVAGRRLRRARRSAGCSSRRSSRGIFTVSLSRAGFGVHARVVEHHRQHARPSCGSSASSGRRRGARRRDRRRSARRSGRRRCRRGAGEAGRARRGRSARFLRRRRRAMPASVRRACASVGACSGAASRSSGSRSAANSPAIAARRVFASRRVRNEPP